VGWYATNSLSVRRHAGCVSNTQRGRVIQVLPAKLGSPGNANEREDRMICTALEHLVFEDVMVNVHSVTGREAILRAAGGLTEFAECCGQPEAAHDLGYFLSKPGALPRMPRLLLIGNEDLDGEKPRAESLLGAVLIFEQRIAGVGLGAFATNDRSGRGSVIARCPDRARVAGLAAELLMHRGAHLVLMSFRGGEPHETEGAFGGLLSGLRGRNDVRWTWREREIPGYLPLCPTLEATLAGLGTRTRRNLRYYRRRAELDLGATFVPDAKVSRAELLRFNRDCMYAAPRRVASWRYASLAELDEPILMGMRDGMGRWLSLLGGRRYLDRSEILWQMNREGPKASSVGTAMRAYFVEHEIAHGSRRLYAEGGTGHSMSFSFVRERVTDLVVKRDTLASKAMQLLARRYIPPDNELSRTLQSPALRWKSC
jgi:hypothetical protein